jgi:ankyrin repeat protein|nr:ankyrin repeat domain-containing protein [Kofleriaceae bacterium]
MRITAVGIGALGALAVLVACHKKPAEPPADDHAGSGGSAAPAQALDAANELATYVAMNRPLASVSAFDMPPAERDRVTAILAADPATGMMVLEPSLDVRWAHALTTWPGKVIAFTNLQTLTADSARELARWHGDTMFLLVKTLEPGAAEALASWPGKALYFDGVSLDAASAAGLAKFSGATLGLAHVDQSPQVAEALSAYHGAVAITLAGPQVTPTVATPPAESDADLEKLGRISHAVDDSDLPAIQAFLAAGGPVDMNERGTTLLMEATNRKQLEPAKLLVAAHANVNAANASGLTPLYYALDDMSPSTPEVVSALVHLLVDAGASVSPKDMRGDMYRRPLTQVAARGDLALASYLLAKGADAAGADPDGTTALIAAIDAGHAELVPVLIKAGAAIDPKDPAMGMSPIHQAISMGAQAVSGARYEHADAAKVRALIAQWRAVLDAVLAAHPNLVARDARGETALETAVSLADLDTLTHLLDAKPDLAAVDGSGRSILQYLATLNRPEPELVAEAKLLIARGASTKPASGDAPSAIAATQHHGALAAALK